MCIPYLVLNLLHKYRKCDILYLCTSYYTIYCCFGQAIFRIFCDLRTFRRSAQNMHRILFIFSKPETAYLSDLKFLVRAGYIVPQKNDSVKTKSALSTRFVFSARNTIYPNKNQTDARYMHLPGFIMVWNQHFHRFRQLSETAVYRRCKRNSVIRLR